MSRAPTRRVMGLAGLLLGLLAAGAAAAGAWVPATYGAHVSVDEPQYLLTARSLWEDGDLDIADEIADGRWRAFSDVGLPTQTLRLPGGRQVSPHDPLLAVLLAAPMGLGDWLGAKLALAGLAGATAALTCWIAVRRFAVPLRLAAAGVGVGFASAPLAVYGQQVYPELPAALATLVGVAALTGPLDRRGQAWLVGAVVALPWLAVKYVPVAAVLAGLGLWRVWRGPAGPARSPERGRGSRAALRLAAVLGVAGVGYLLVHRLVWGGWTVYATGDHFAGTGEWSVVGVSPDYVGRSLRLVALLADRDFGLAPWQPAWLLVVPAVAALARHRQTALLGPLAAGWATATWLALTMHGYWWPGRQLVVVLPLALLAVLVWLHRLPRLVARVVQPAAGLLGLAGVWTYAAVLLDGLAGRLTWVVDPQSAAAPAYHWSAAALPDYRAPGFLPGHLFWAAVLLGLAGWGWRSLRGSGRTSTRRPHRAIGTPTTEGAPA